MVASGVFHKGKVGMGMAGELYVLKYQGVK